MGTARKAIVFTSTKAWLIVRPMTKELDLKFYYGEPLNSGVLKKVQPYNKKFAHHIRIKNENQLNEEVFRLLKKGHEYTLTT